MGRDMQEYCRMILGKPKEDIKHSEIETLLEYDDVFARSTAAQALGKKGGRDACNHLIELMRDPVQDVVIAAIIASAHTKDSRFIFPLVNKYNQGDYKEKASVLMAINAMKDPRSIDFLTEIKETDENLKKMIKTYIANHDPEKEFVYTFKGTEEERIKAEKEDKLRIKITKPEDFNALPIYLDNEIRKTGEDYGPLTYIVDKNKDLYIGALVEEHVVVARGQDVVAAGEITVSLQDEEWVIKEINNRSNGYFPARTTYNIMGRLLDKIGIRHPGKFTYLHPREGFFSDEFLQMFAFHPEYEKIHSGKKRKK